MNERAVALLTADRYATNLGIRLVEAASDRVTVAMTVTDEMTNFLGGLHGGALFSLADCAFSLASNLAGDRAVAIDTHLVLAAAVEVGEELTAIAEEVSRGRTLGTYRVLVNRADGRVAGHFTGTVYITSNV
ncbi:MAG TPA: hotdog fold thioesterase [Acidimicrobiia bacterium]|nr:hotdog fold thioesterase [Acidimicrobiia bacterium]